MTKNRLLRLVGVSFLALGVILIGVKSTKAEVTPTIQLTNSDYNWTVQTGKQLTLNASVQPYDYRLLSKMEIRQGNNILATCWNQNSCYYTLSSVASGTSYFQAIGYDVDGRVFYSSVMNLVGQSPQADFNSPEVNLYANFYDVDPVSNSGLYIEARAHKPVGIRDLRIYRTDNWALQSTSNCSNSQYDCTIRFYPVFTSADAGKTFQYQAQTTDNNGITGSSNWITIHVRGVGETSNRLPGVYLDRGTIPETVDANSVVHIRAEAWDHEGLNRMSIYVTRQHSYSYGYGYEYSSQFPFAKTCSSLGHNLTCTLDINSFWGYEGQNFDVWSEVIDAAGNRVVSNIYTMRVNGSPAQPELKPVVTIDTSSFPTEVRADQSVSIRATATDQGGLYRMSITATPRSYSYGYGNNYSQYVYSQNCEGSNLPRTLNCTLNISNFSGYEGQTFDVWARAFDGYNTVYSQFYTIRVQGNTVVDQKPGISIQVPTEVKSNGKLSIQADAWDNEGLSQINVYFDAYPVEAFSYTNGGYVNRLCTVSGKNASCTLEVGDLKRFKGRTASVWAIAVDTNGNRTQTQIKSVRIVAAPTPAKTAPTVTTQITGNNASLQEDKTVNISGRATSPNGVWGVEIRALPSWSNQAITRRCIMDNKSTTVATCDMNIGPFNGHANGTVKVWTIAWDTKTGMGGSSDAKNIKITAKPNPNFAPSATITPSRRAIAPNQTVNFVVNASDTDGIEKIDIYVNARIVKTCTNTTSCSYTGGPFRDYAGTSVSYATKVWDKTGKETWSSYEYISVSREVSVRGRASVATR